MDAGLLREIAAKVDDDLIDVNDAKVLRGIAESVDRVLEWCEGARSKEEVEEILFGNAEQPKDVTLKPWDGRPLTPHPSVIVDEKRKRIIGILEEYPDANAEDTWLKVADAILALWQPEQASGRACTDCGVPFPYGLQSVAVEHGGFVCLECWSVRNAESH